MAKDFGVDGTLLNDSPENFEKGVAEITNGNGFDVTIEQLVFRPHSRTVSMPAASADAWF